MNYMLLHGAELRLCTLGFRPALLPSKLESTPFQNGEPFRALTNLNHPILSRIRNHLRLLPKRPPDLDRQNRRILPQPNMLLKRIRAEGTAAAHRPIDLAWLLPAIPRRHFDPSPNRRPVRFHPYQMNAEPV